MIWGPHDHAAHYHLYDDRSGTVEIVGADCLTENGHMTYSPDKRWILSDTYPDENDHRLVILFDTKTGKRYVVGHFYTGVDLKNWPRLHALTEAKLLTDR